MFETINYERIIKSKTSKWSRYDNKYKLQKCH